MPDISPPLRKPPSSVKQNIEKPLYLAATRQELQVLIRFLHSPSLIGRVLRTLAYYAQYPQPPQREEDYEVLLAVSSALARGRKPR